MRYRSCYIPGTQTAVRIFPVRKGHKMSCSLLNDFKSGENRVPLVNIDCWSDWNWDILLNGDHLFVSHPGANKIQINVGFGLGSSHMSVAPIWNTLIERKWSQPRTNCTRTLLSIFHIKLTGRSNWTGQPTNARRRFWEIERELLYDPTSHPSQSW